ISGHAFRGGRCGRLAALLSAAELVVITGNKCCLDEKNRAVPKSDRQDGRRFFRPLSWPTSSAFSIWECSGPLMSDRKLAVVVLAAGKGSRMKSDFPKVLHPVAGKAMLWHVLNSVAALAPAETVVVVAPGMDDVAAAAAPARCVVQAKPLGTGHAVAAARDALAAFAARGAGDLLVVFGDCPLMTGETLARLVAARREAKAPDIVGLAFRPADPAAYGRVILDEGGRVEKIVEFADADSAQR